MRRSRRHPAAWPGRSVPPANVSGHRRRRDAPAAPVPVRGNSAAMRRDAAWPGRRPHRSPAIGRRRGTHGSSHPAGHAARRVPAAPAPATSPGKRPHAPHRRWTARCRRSAKTTPCACARSVPWTWRQASQRPAAQAAADADRMRRRRASAAAPVRRSAASSRRGSGRSARSAAPRSRHGRRGRSPPRCWRGCRTARRG